MRDAVTAAVKPLAGHWRRDLKADEGGLEVELAGLVSTRRRSTP
jgi:hypothetical protein